MSNDRLLPSANNGAIVAAGSATDDFIKSRIFTIRGVQVMLDRDLAVLYGVETGALNSKSSGTASVSRMTSCFDCLRKSGAT